MTTTFAAIRERTSALQAQIAALQAEAAEQIKPLLQQFIIDNPAVTGIRWTQYTPYFNDGETCEFSVHEPRFQFNGQEEGADYDDGYFDVPYKWAPGEQYYSDFCEACGSEALYRACKELSDELQGMDDALQSLFGDHAEITVTKDGVEVEEYSHD